MHRGGTDGYMERVMELSGIKNAGIVVTGAAQGIGEGVARHLASGGARLALIDRQA